MEKVEKIKLVFEDWIGRDGKSVYLTEPELSLGSLHSGTTFNAEVDFSDEEMITLMDANKRGIRPVFQVIER